MASLSLRNIKKIYPFNSDDVRQMRKQQKKLEKKEAAEAALKEKMGEEAELEHDDLLPVEEEEKKAALAANYVEEQEVTIGLRPEHIVLSNSDEGVEAKISVHELMGSSVHLHVRFQNKDVIIIVNTMDMTGAEIAELCSGKTVKFDFGGNNCHVFSKETKVNLEAAPVAAPVLE